MTRSAPRRLLPALVLLGLAVLGAGAWVMLGGPATETPVGALEDEDGVGETADVTEEPETPRSSRRRSERRERRSRRESEEGGAPGTAPEPPKPVFRDTLIVEKGDVVRLPTGTVHVRGDVRVEGELIAQKTTLVLDGGDQTLSGNSQLGRLILRGGVKRVQGQFGNVATKPAGVGEAQLIVEKNTTLVIDDSGAWQTRNAYGYRIEGHLVIDGGTFTCVFFNGDGRPGEEGKDSREDSWAQGSSLTIRRGKFIASGDADFQGATVTLYDGELTVNDDLWSLGDRFVQYGGKVQNSRWGGAFGFTGTVELYGGVLDVRQSSRRGLYLLRPVVFQGAGGHIRISGRDAGRGQGGMKLLAPLTVGRMTVNVSTHVHEESDAGAYVTVTEELVIAKGKTLDPNGRPVYADFESTDANGTLVR